MAPDFPGHVRNVFGPLAHRRRVGRLQPLRHVPGDRSQGPFGIHAVLAHPFDDGREQRLVGGDHPVRLQDGGELRAHVPPRFPRVLEKVLGRRAGGPPEAALLGLQRVGRKGAAKRGRPPEPHDDGAAHRDARSDRKTLKHKN